MLKLSADVAPITSTTGSPFNVQISSGTGTINTNGHNATIDQPIIGGGRLNKGGTGVLTLTGSSTYSGGTTITAGAILAESSAALGTGTVTISNGGTSTASLQLAGGINLANSFAGFNSEVAGSTPTFENISGNNTISSNLSITGTGGNGVIFQSDAGLFTLSGTLTTTLTTTRTYIFQGTGNGVVTGSIADDASDILRVVKTGTGTWTLTGTNSYADGTTINAGTLSATGLAVSGAVSATSTGTFSNMSIAGAPWTDTDIGAPSLAGAATFNTANTYTVAGSGSDITGAHDQLNFVSQPFVGDGGITAEVNGSPVNTDSTTTTGSKDGIMFRDDLLADGSFVEIGYTTGSGIQLLYRDGNGATVQVGGTASSITGAVWLSLNRVQGTYTASYSTDGSTFTTLGTVTTENIGENAFVGMLVSSHDNTKTATATFSNVAITTSLVASTTEADLAFTVPWLSSSDTLVYADDGSGWEMVADAPAGTSSVALTSLTADESYSIELASATAVVAAGGTTTGNTPPALTTADSTLAPTDTDVTLYQVIADSSLSEGISSATDTGSVVVAHEYVYADDEIEAAGLAGITVTNFESNGHADGNFDGGVVEAGNTGHTAPDNEPSLAELLGIDNSTPILAVEDGTDGDFNDAFANLTIVEL
jgi:fibronectin-binding autotransporter adhesin